jgi:hypothetical protein
MMLSSSHLNMSDGQLKPASRRRTRPTAKELQQQQQQSMNDQAKQQQMRSKQETSSTSANAAAAAASYQSDLGADGIFRFTPTLSVAMPSLIIHFDDDDNDAAFSNQEQSYNVKQANNRLNRRAKASTQTMTSTTSKPLSQHLLQPISSTNAQSSDAEEEKQQQQQEQSQPPLTSLHSASSHQLLRDKSHTTIIAPLPSQLNNTNNRNPPMSEREQQLRSLYAEARADKIRQAEQTSQLAAAKQRQLQTRQQLQSQSAAKNTNNSQFAPSDSVGRLLQTHKI